MEFGVLQLERARCLQYSLFGCVYGPKRAIYNSQLITCEERGAGQARVWPGVS